MSEQIPIKNIYYMLCYAWDRLNEKDIILVDNTEGNNLLDLFARVMVNGLNYLIKRGLDRRYLCVNDDISFIRGKIDFNNSIKTLQWVNGRMSCEYDDLSHNVLHNQIIKTTIEQLIKHKGLSDELKDGLLNLYKYFRYIDTIKLNKKVFKEVQINRNNQYYDFLLKVCETIYDNLLIDENTGQSKFKEFERDPKQMAYLFENFVRNFYKRELKGCKVYRENINWDTDDDNTFNEYLPQMQTDISIETDSKKIIIDTKFYKDTFTYYMDSKKLISSNLYQIFAYIKNIEAKGGLNTNAEGILLYPMVNQQIDYDYLIQGHKIMIRTVDLNQEWRLIHKRLIDIIIDREN